MKHVKRLLCTLLLSAILVSSLAACQIGSNKVKISEFSKTEVAKYGDESIYLDEVYYFVKLSQVTYDYYFSIYGGYLLGSNATLADWYDSVISLFGTKLTTWNLIRENVFRTIYQTRVLCDQADRLGISLNEDDKKKIEDAVKEAFKEENRTIVDAARASEDLIRAIYTRNALATKVAEKISEGYSKDIVRDEYKTATATIFTVTKDAKDETDEKAKAEAILEAVRKELIKISAPKPASEDEQSDDGKETKEDDKKEEEKKIDFDQIKKDLTDGSDVKNPVTFTLSKSQNVGVSTNMTDVEKAVWSMKVGELKMIENDKAFSIIYLEDDDNEEAVQDKIDAALETRKENEFTKEYKKLLETAKPLTVIDKIYEANIKFSEINYPESTTAEATTTEATTAETTTTQASSTTTSTETSTEASTEADTTEASNE